MKKFPFHIILIIIFFLTHGYAENNGLLAFSDLLVFFLISAFSSLMVYWIFYKVCGNTAKAGIATTLVIGLYLFFGAFVDTLSWLGKMHYRYLLPMLLVALIALLYLIWRTRLQFTRLNFYLNTLFLIFIAYDLVTIGFSHSINQKEQVILPTFDSHLTRCDSCAKPDIYFVLLDQYSGTRTLEKYLHYDNSGFENFLRAKGFHVISNPSSNYPTTILSLASILNMSFIKGFTDSQFNAQDYARLLPLIRQNLVTNYLTSCNYQFHNYSIFDVHQQPSLFTHHFFPSNMQLILDKTLVERLKKDLFIDKKIGPFKLQFGIEWEAEAIRKANLQAIQRTISAANAKDTQPKFVYTHLLMPHPPYLYDSLGNTMNLEIGNVPKPLLNSSYLNYLVYTNKVVEKLIEQLFSATKGRAVIILMSDHGNKHFYPWPPPEDRFATMNAIYLPDKNYLDYHDGFYNVNEFRVLFNKLFHQRLPMLKDSTAFFHD